MVFYITASSASSSRVSGQPVAPPVSGRGRPIPPAPKRCHSPAADFQNFLSKPCSTILSTTLSLHPWKTSCSLLCSGKPRLYSSYRPCQSGGYRRGYRSEYRGSGYRSPYYYYQPYHYYYHSKMWAKIVNIFKCRTKWFWYFQAYYSQPIDIICVRANSIINKSFCSAT